VADNAGNVYFTALSNCGFGTGCEASRIQKVSPSGVITTVAGGASGYSGDSGPAASAQLNNPSGLAMDGTGNLYIADSDNNRIRKVSPTGIITTVAGNGNAGYSGDGGPAAGGQFNTPTGLALDSAGSLYIADYGNSRIRKVSSAGILTTIAGNGTFNYLGDDGPATAGQLSQELHAITLDGAGNLYIADQFNMRVRKISANRIISTIAGSGMGGFSGDGGPAFAAGLQRPEGLAVDVAGNLYISDPYNYRVRKVLPNGIITTVAGNGSQGYSGDGGPATQAQLNRPVGVAVDGAGNLYIADYFNYRIRKVTDGIISTIAGKGTFGYSGDGGPAVSAQLVGPFGLAVDAAGNVYAADSVSPAHRFLPALPSDRSAWSVYSNQMAPLPRSPQSPTPPAIFRLHCSRRDRRSVSLRHRTGAIDAVRSE
jgi:sugar lactone lactonase YvrE